jgi:hypothetical protein
MIMSDNGYSVYCKSGLIALTIQPAVSRLRRCSPANLLSLLHLIAAEVLIVQPF